MMLLSLCFLHLLLTASFKAGTWEGIEITKGQLITSNESLSKDLGYSIQRIRTALKKLKSTGEITIKTTSK